jgi:NADPH:quinone reductase
MSNVFGQTGRTAEIPTKLFAAYYETIGEAADVLRFGEFDMTKPGPGEVLVELRAIGINPADVKRRGSTPVPAGRKLVPGDDGAGIIMAVGAGVSAKRIGQRVWTYNGRLGRDFGTCASHVVAPAERVVPLPEGVSFEAGACLGVPGITAHYALFVDGDIEGQTILVHGGAGGVGSTVVQLAKWGGATVIATVSGDAKAAIASACGADYVVNYKTENVVERVRAVTEGAGVDRVVDVAFGVNLETNLEVLKDNGIIATYSSDADWTPAIPFWRLLRKNIRVHFLIVYTLTRPTLRVAVRDITSALGAGALAPVVTELLPLRELVRAHEIVGKFSGIGNLVLLPDTAC